MKLPSVTIAIPTFNGLGWLKHSLRDLSHQQYDGELQILTMDSGSNDGTVEYLKSQGVAVFPLSSQPFNHGKTRNELLQKVKTELVLFTVQDARPSSSSWIQSMVSALIESEADAICGGQCVPESKETNPFQWFRPITKQNKTTTYDSLQFQTATAEARFSMCCWDNVNSIYKTDILKKIPFPHVDFGEDMAWAKTALEANVTIGYCDHGKVFHYHHENPDFVRNRVIAIWRSRWELFKIQPPGPIKLNMWWWTKNGISLIYHYRIISPPRIVYWLLHNWRNSRARNQAIVEVIQGISNDNLEDLQSNLKDRAALAPTIKNADQ